MKIAFVGLISDTNLGDKVIFDNTVYLYRKQFNTVFPGIDFIDVYIDLYGNLLKKDSFKYLITRITNKILLSISKSYKTICSVINSRIFIFENMIPRDVNAIVIVGGGLIKYRYQNVFLYNLCALIEFAKKYNIPVIFNAIGIEGFDKCDSRCRVWHKYLNYSNVVAITTRDDIDTLKNFIVDKNRRVYIKNVSDPAVWSNVTYNIKRNDNTNLVGIGLIRGNIFKDNDIDFDKDSLIELYADIVQGLIVRKIDFCFFTNGNSNDEEIFEEICNKINRFDVRLLRPKSNRNGIDLVDLIKEFRFVVAARLHANIIAYSLGIPSIGLIWNDKLKFWSKNIGKQNLFFDIKELINKGVNTKEISNLILNEINLDIGYNLKETLTFRNSIIRSIDDIFKLLCK